MVQVLVVSSVALVRRATRSKGLACVHEQGGAQGAYVERTVASVYTALPPLPRSGLQWGPQGWDLEFVTKGASVSIIVGYDSSGEAEGALSGGDY